jgi:hypothetical protein
VKKRRGGRRKPLKRLDSEKEIQGLYLDFVAPDLDFVASGLDLVAGNLENHHRAGQGGEFWYCKIDKNIKR